jgi:hypothetical protein
MIDATELQIPLQKFHRFSVRFNRSHMVRTTADGFDPDRPCPCIEVQKATVCQPMTED